MALWSLAFNNNLMTPSTSIFKVVNSSARFELMTDALSFDLERLPLMSGEADSTERGHRISLAFRKIPENLRLKLDDISPDWCFIRLILDEPTKDNWTKYWRFS